MRYLIPAVLVVAAIIAGLLWLPDYWPTDDAAVDTAARKNDAAFVDLPTPEAPDYSTVVTDEVLARELAAEAEGYLDEISDANQPNRAEDQGVHLQTAAQTVEFGGQAQPLAGILQRYGIQPQADSLYFAHTVNRADAQGVWGIVQAQLVARFADGVALRRGEQPSDYQLLIPKFADERNADGSSSFLGKVIWHKSQSAMVINQANGLARQGEDADIVLPQSDLVIVTFSRQELVAIYQYFATTNKR